MRRLRSLGPELWSTNFAPWPGPTDLPLLLFVCLFVRFLWVPLKRCSEKNLPAAVKGVLPLLLCSLSWKNGLSGRVIFKFKVEGFFFPFSSKLAVFRTLLKLMQNRGMT